MKRIDVINGTIPEDLYYLLLSYNEMTNWSYIQNNFNEQHLTYLTIEQIKELTDVAIEYLKNNCY
ncbi:MAG: hypothetical protein RSE41_00425 [Clostridia bacterium]